jgi:hypothetical protein
MPHDAGSGQDAVEVGDTLRQPARSASSGALRAVVPPCDAF